VRHCAHNLNCLRAAYAPVDAPARTVKKRRVSRAGADAAVDDHSSNTKSQSLTGTRADGCSCALCVCDTIPAGALLQLTNVAMVDIAFAVVAPTNEPCDKKIAVKWLQQHLHMFRTHPVQLDGMVSVALTNHRRAFERTSIVGAWQRIGRLCTPWTHTLDKYLAIRDFSITRKRKPRPKDNPRPRTTALDNDDDDEYTGEDVNASAPRNRSTAIRQSRANAHADDDDDNDDNDEDNDNDNDDDDAPTVTSSANVPARPALPGIDQLVLPSAASMFALPQSQHRHHHRHHHMLYSLQQQLQQLPPADAALLLPVLTSAGNGGDLLFAHTQALLAPQAAPLLPPLRTPVHTRTAPTLTSTPASEPLMPIATKTMSATSTAATNNKN
jgi:hypothetical protein